MDKNNSFSKSLLSSAIIAATLQTLSVSAQAATCPSPNASGNIHVGTGEFCEGGITVDAGSGPVNDIGIQGRVNGDVLVDDGISDFWMSTGELNGSLINNTATSTVNIDNDSTLFSDIQNNGSMAFLTVSDDPGVPTVIHGNIANDGNIQRVHITGSQTLVKGSVVTSALGTISQRLLIDHGATIAGNVSNAGDFNDIQVNDAHIGGDLTNAGDGDNIVLNEASTVGGHFENSGDVFALAAMDGSTVDGNMINNGRAVIIDVSNGSHIGADLVNNGFIDGAIIINNATVAGDVLNNTDAFANELVIREGASVGSVTNKGDTRFLFVDDSDVETDLVNSGTIDGIIHVTDGSTIGQDIINNGVINPGNSEPFFGPVDGMSEGIAGIALNNGSVVAGELVNNGSITLDYTPAPLPDGITSDGELFAASLAGISVKNGSNAHRIVNNGVITVTTGLEHDSPAFKSGMHVNGIEVVKAATSGDVINDGVITADSFGIFIDGEGQDGATVDGDVINTADGVITSKDNGIYIHDAKVTGVISNEGIVTSTEDNAIDIENSVIGGLENSGTLTSKYWYDGVDIDDTSVLGDIKNLSSGVINGEDAFDVIHSSIQGSLVNHGTFNVNNNGFELDNTDIGENLINSGTINAGGDGIVYRGSFDDGVTDYATISGNIEHSGLINADGTGIALDYAEVMGDFSSTGEIIAGSGIALYESIIHGNMVTGDISAVQTGVILEEGTRIDGSFIGQGDISSENTDAIFIMDTTIGKSIFNEGALTAGGEGFDLNRVSIGEHFQNQGDITGISAGIDFDDVSVGHSVNNSGDITSNGASMYFHGVSIGGDFFNSGNLSSEVDSGILFVDNNTIAGGFQNEGNITAKDYGVALLGDKTYDPVDGQVTVNSVMTVGGDVTNTGAIISGREAIIVRDADIAGSLTNSGDLSSDSNHGLSIGGVTVIGGDLSNTGDITADQNAINIEGIVQVGGDITNSGDLTGNEGIYINSDAFMKPVVDADGQTLDMDTTDGLITVAGGLTNEGTITTEGDGIRLKGIVFGDTIKNTGDITAEEGNALHFDDLIVHGNIENHGTLTVLEEDEGDGIDIDNAIVKGSVINFGTMNIEGTEGFDIEDAIIEGNVTNAVDGVLNVRSDGFYIKDTHIKGSLINNGTLIAKEHDGIDIQIEDYDRDGSGITTRIDGDLISTGTITAGDNGFELDGLWKDGYTTESTDGMITVPGEAVKMAIGGALYNSGDIVAKDRGIDLQLVSVGANGVLDDGQANFENHGNVTSGVGGAINVIASDIAGHFINEGDLTVIDGPLYSAGDEYRRYTGDSQPEGEITLTAVGTDENGNSWFRIKNESDGFTPVTLSEQGGDFDTGYLGLNAGEEVYITVGDSMDGSENYVLSVMEDGPDAEPSEQLVTVDTATVFQPAYKVGSTYAQNGITLTSKTYGTGTEFEQRIKTTIGGGFKNTGAITALDTGIDVEGVDVGGAFINEGAINAQKGNAIALNDVTIGGDFTNTGHLDASQGVTSQEGDSYRQDWGGTPSDDGEVVLISKGADEHGNQWVVVRNEGDEPQPFMLDESGGNFVMNQFTLEPGQEVFINVGTLEGDLQLRYPWGESILATTSGSESDFTPEGSHRNGVRLTDVTIAGELANTGDVAALDEGLYLNNVSIGGGFTNTGNITSENETGISFAKDVTVGGDFINEGDITAAKRGIELLGDLNTDADGQQVVNSLMDISGAFVNRGDIVVTNDGIRLVDASVGGGFENSGDITTIKDGANYAINIYGDTQIGGDIINTGHLVGSKGIRVVGDSIMNDEGLLVDGDTVTVAGSLINHGDIDARNDAIRIRSAELGGSVINTGHITTDTSNALDIAHAIIGGNIENHGTIENLDSGNAVELNDVIVKGSIINAGTIITEGSEGIDVEQTVIEGHVINTGLISADSDAIIMENNLRIYGSIVNDGTLITGNEGIELDQFVVDGSIVNNGTIQSANDGIELDGDHDERSILKGDLINAGDIRTHKNEWSSSNGDEGIHVDDVDIHGSFIHTGIITTGDDEGVYMDDFSIGGDFLAGNGEVGSGRVVADEEGYELEGGRRWHEGEETTDGVTSSYYTYEYSTIGGRLVNKGDITSTDSAFDLELVSIGVNGDLADGAANFENHGVLTVADDHAIDIQASSIAGDFINTGVLSAKKAPQYEVGDTIYRYNGFTQPDGETVIESLGVDEYNNGWLTVRNEGSTHHQFVLMKNGEVFDDLYVSSGESRTINLGEGSDTDQFTLHRAEQGQPLPDGEIAAVNQNTDSYTAPYVMGDNEFKRGINLTEKTFYTYNNIENRNEEDAVRVSVGGSFINTGEISAIDEGVHLKGVDIGAELINTGAITTERGTAIELNDVTVGGDLVNTGDLVATNLFKYQKGESYTRDWEGTPTVEGEMVFESLGMDKNGDHWYVVRNEGMSGYSLEVTEVDGHFSTRDFYVDPGKERVINAGQVSGDMVLSEYWGGTNVSLTASTNNQSFTPEYMDQNGLRVNNTQVDGSFYNSGAIHVADQGILVAGSTIGGDAVNSGAITSGNSYGIEINASTIGGMLGNSGAITSDNDALYISGATIGGSLVNTGELSSTTGAGVLVEGTSIAGNVENTGAITSDYDALYISDTDITGGVVNRGHLNVADGIGIIIEDDSTVGGGVVNYGAINASYEGIALYDSSIGGQVINEGSIASDYVGVYVEGNDIAGDIYNFGTIESTESGLFVTDTNVTGNVVNAEGASITVNEYGGGMWLNGVTGLEGFENHGTITTRRADEDLSAGMLLENSSMSGVVANKGTIDSAGLGLGIYEVTGVTNIINDGHLKAGAGGLLVANTTMDGVIFNGAGAQIEAGNKAVTIDNVTGADALVNYGAITSTGHTAVLVNNSQISGVVNAGTITGGTVTEASGEAVAVPEGMRVLEEQQVALDFRTSQLTFENTDLITTEGVVIGGGIINGDILGRTEAPEGEADSDRVIFSSTVGEMSGDIYDVENVDITGSIALKNTLFSFNDSSTLTVKNVLLNEETGERTTLKMGDSNIITVQGDYVQEGHMSFEVDESVLAFTEARIDASGAAEIAESSVFIVTLKDDDLSKLNPLDGEGRDLHVVHAADGITTPLDAETGNVNMTVQDNTILLNQTVNLLENDTQMVINTTVADTGLLANAGGADVNAQNAIRALQGVNSQGLIDLRDLDKALYDQLYNGTETDFAAVAEQLVASPETGIAAGQSAQAEAVNTILTRIAELRTGASGISAGDDDESSNIRPDSLWIRAIYTDGDQKATSHNGSDFNAYSLRSSGFTIGADKDVSDTLTLGAGVTLANSTVNEKGSAQGANSETQTVLGSVYAGWRDQDYFADASVSVGKGGTDLKSSEWEADYDSTQIGVSVLAGKSILFNNNDTLIEPRVGFNYTRLETDEYSYTGTAGKETIGSQNLETLELGAGVRFITGIEVGDGLLLPEASLMAWHDFKGDNVEANVEFETGGGSFTYFGPDAEKTRYQAGVGAEYLMDNNFSVSVNYEHNWQDGFKADTVVAKLRYDF